MPLPPPDARIAAAPTMALGSGSSAVTANPFARKRVAGNAAPGAHVERPAGAPAQHLRNRLPFVAIEITLGRSDQRIVIKRVEHELPLVRLVAQPDHGVFPGRYFGQRASGGNSLTSTAGFPATIE